MVGDEVVMNSKLKNRKLNAKDIWVEMMGLIQEQVTKTSFTTWFTPVDKIEIDHDLKVIHMGSGEEDQVNSVLNSRYIKILETAAEDVLGYPYRIIIDKVIEEAAADNEVLYEDDDAHLMPQYVFDNFVVGEKNKLAHGIALQVAKAPSLAFNPLFIHSKSGLGKTHLLHAIGNYIAEHDPGKKLLYTSSEEFTREFVESLSSHDRRQIQGIKRKYRSLDVLMIDDIQFIEGKPKTQEEFFHIFNDLYNKGKQIIICSDKEPAALTELEERLRSRFQWNMVVGIEEPDYETRVAILFSKAREKNLQLDEPGIKAIELIAENIRNIRELEGALTRLTAFAAVLGEEITPDFVRDTLPDIIKQEKGAITDKDIKGAVSKAFGIKAADLESSKRSKEIVLPRHVAMYLCRDVAEMSFKEIGRAFGNRNHTTVMSACEKIEKEIHSNMELKSLILELIDKLE